MRRSSNASSKPFQPLPTRRASFNGGFEPDFNSLLQNDIVILEQQQQQLVQTSAKKSPRKLVLNSSILPPTPKLANCSSVQPTGTLTNAAAIIAQNAATISASQEQHSNLPSNLYKTELCRSFEETGTCRYGSKCQFAHGYAELRPAPRHPKYKTEICKTFHSIGTCPYGTRCRFIHTSPSDNLDWITADVDNPLFDLNDKNAPEFDRSPNTIPSVPTYQSFMARLPLTPQRYQSNYHSQVSANEPLLSVVRAEIPPRLEPNPRLESRTLSAERPSTSAPIAPTNNLVPNSIPPSTTAPTSVNLTPSTNSISSVNIAPATINLAVAITPPLPPTPSTVTVTTNTKTIPSVNNVTTVKPSTTVTSVQLVSNSNASSTAYPAPGHKHRLPIFRELCHQSSVERLQQQMLDFVFEKEQ